MFWYKILKDGPKKTLLLNKNSQNTLEMLWHIFGCCTLQSPLWSCQKYFNKHRHLIKYVFTQVTNLYLAVLCEKFGVFRTQFCKVNNDKVLRRAFSSNCALTTWWHGINGAIADRRYSPWLFTSQLFSHLGDACYFNGIGMSKGQHNGLQHSICPPMYGTFYLQQRPFI